jgi:hypothetical protein
MSDSISAEEYNAMMAKPKPSKYGNRKVVVDDIPFDSQAEADRYWELAQLRNTGEITELELQPVFPLLVNGAKVAEYRADFRYRDESGVQHVEDVKGVRTPVYQLKKKMVRAQYGTEIEEIEA